MSWFRRTVGNIGWDGVLMLLCGISAMGITIADYASLLDVSAEIMLRMILVGIGLVLWALAATSSRRTSELNSIATSLHANRVALLEDGAMFHLSVVQRIVSARKFVLDTTLSTKPIDIMHPADNPMSYQSAIYDRVSKGELTFRRIVAIASRERLESEVLRLLAYEGSEYLVRFVEAAPRPVPVLNMISVDNDVYFLGGFHTSDAPDEAGHSVQVQSLEIGQLLNAYWMSLWQSARPLNEGKRINWDEVKSIAEKLDITVADYEELVDRCRSRVQRRKRSGRSLTVR